MNIRNAHRGVVLGFAIGLLALAGTACVDLNRPAALTFVDAGNDAGGGAGIGGTGTGGSGGSADVRNLLAIGQACQAATECETGFCAAGFCCDAACGGPCESCGVPGNEGVCRLFEAGTDPKDACPDEGAASCGGDGMCDSAGACRLYPNTTVCRANVCGGSSMVNYRCNGTGACMPVVSSSCYPYVCGTTVACRTTCATSVDCVSPAACFVGNCGGITATYFDNQDFTGRSATRVERGIDFDFGTGAPHPMIGADSFSIRFTGRLTPPVTDTYTFYGASDDGIRIWIDDQPIIDDWRIRAVVESRGTVALTAGKTVAIKVEYFDSEMAASIKVSWSNPQLPKQVIPATALTP